MPNLFWYICLAISGLGSTVYSIWMNRDIYRVSTLLVFYLFTAGISWIGEFTVLGLFNSYAYKTGLFTNPWAQNLLGHLILNTTLYPAAAIVMVAFSFRFKWMLFVATLFTLIEYLFVKSGLYEQHWWRYYMTFITVAAILSIGNKTFDKIKKGCSGLTRAIIFYFVALIIIHTPAPVLLLLGKQYYHIGIINNLFGDLYLSSIIIIFSYHLIEAFLLVIFTCILKRWYWRLLPFAISITVQSMLVKIGILVMEDGWKLIYTLIIYEIFIAAFIMIERYTVKPDIN